MLKKFQSLAKSLFVKHPIPLHETAFAKVTPDELIAAVVIKSIAENFDAWKFTVESRSGINTVKCALENEKFTIKFKYSKYCGSYYPEYTINGVPIAEKQIEEIHKAWLKIKTERDRLERIAAQKKKEMEDNERKWNLYEDIMGLKRNEFGALVPKVSVEETIAPEHSVKETV
jgi:hypothetical protein